MNQSEPFISDMSHQQSLLPCGLLAWMSGVSGVSAASRNKGACWGFGGGGGDWGLGILVGEGVLTGGEGRAIFSWSGEAFESFHKLRLALISEKESDEFIKSSVEDLVLVPSETEDTSESDSDCDLPSCDDISPINVYEEKAVTFSNPLFDSNDDFTSSDDESLSDEDVLEDNFKIYSNPLFEFDNEYISNDVNPLFDEVLEDIECKDSYDST
ncbi:hypothetical protein Tco_0687764 [Tanacetum coccineum]